MGANFFCKLRKLTFRSRVRRTLFLQNIIYLINEDIFQNFAQRETKKSGNEPY